jgi:hypothetical protein
MRHFNPFTHTAEQNRVVSNDITGANRLDADFLFLPFSDEAFSRIHPDLVQIAAYGLSKYLGDLQRRATRCILLESMMGLDDFDIVLVPQRLGHFTDHPIHEIHAHAHVR